MFDSACGGFWEGTAYLASTSCIPSSTGHFLLQLVSISLALRPRTKLWYSTILVPPFVHEVVCQECFILHGHAEVKKMKNPAVGPFPCKSAQITVTVADCATKTHANANSKEHVFFQLCTGQQEYFFEPNNEITDEWQIRFKTVRGSDPIWRRYC